MYAFYLSIFMRNGIVRHFFAQWMDIHEFSSSQNVIDQLYLDSDDFIF